MVNIVLEGHRGIIEAERYNEGLKKAKPGNKSYLLLMAFRNLELVERGNNV